MFKYIVMHLVPIVGEAVIKKISKKVGSKAGSFGPTTAVPTTSNVASNVAATVTKGAKTFTFKNITAKTLPAVITAVTIVQNWFTLIEFIVKLIYGTIVIAIKILRYSIILFYGIILSGLVFFIYWVKVNNLNLKFTIVLDVIHYLFPTILFNDHIISLYALIFTCIAICGLGAYVHHKLMMKPASPEIGVEQKASLVPYDMPRRYIRTSPTINIIYLFIYGSILAFIGAFIWLGIPHIFNKYHGVHTRAAEISSIPTLEDKQAWLMEIVRQFDEAGLRTKFIEEFYRSVDLSLIESKRQLYLQAQLYMTKLNQVLLSELASPAWYAPIVNHPIISGIVVLALVLITAKIEYNNHYIQKGMESIKFEVGELTVKVDKVFAKKLREHTDAINYIGRHLGMVESKIDFTTAMTLHVDKLFQESNEQFIEFLENWFLISANSNDPKFKEDFQAFMNQFKDRLDEAHVGVDKHAVLFKGMSNLLDGHRRCGNIVEFEQWINNTNATMLPYLKKYQLQFKDGHLITGLVYNEETKRLFREQGIELPKDLSQTVPMPKLGVPMPEDPNAAMQMFVASRNIPPEPPMGLLGKITSYFY